jgi:hypothetical protein
MFRQARYLLIPMTRATQSRPPRCQRRECDILAELNLIRAAYFPYKAGAFSALRQRIVFAQERKVSIELSALKLLVGFCRP